MGEYECFRLQTTRGPRRQYFKNHRPVHSKHVPHTAKVHMKQQMQQQLGGGVQYGTYAKPRNVAVCRGTSPRPRTTYSVNECLLTEADYRAFLRLIVQDRFKREFGRAAPFSQEQYLTALDKQLTARIPPALRATPCTKITAFMPKVDSNLPQQGNYQFMPEFAKLPSATKSKPYWQVVKKLGEGSVGMVYVVVNSKGENYALKIQVVTPGQPRFMSVEDEVKLQNFFANLNLAPRVVGLTTVQLQDPLKTQIKIIVMETIDFTLDDLVCNPNAFPASWVNAVAEEVKQLLLVLHKYGITHGDMHSGNIGFVYDPDTKQLKLRLIDFGQSSNKGNNARVDALQLMHGLSPEFLGVPANILNVFRKKLTEALHEIYGPRATLPVNNYNFTFSREHNNYSRLATGLLGFKERAKPEPEPNFPEWFNP